ncbi:serine/threonine-protein kinase mtor [Anaeramoeba flamelloides]|uniref:Serine/threonine-protein kinase TOR n=1 Tax=Anaeramoeba flamelloides TaxID=1746091 RepID=A0AAV7ZYL4_9EUKA|nr:serine/threonine-protein kinase mtor [Anaeramoeba flamelloides]
MNESLLNEFNPIFESFCSKNKIVQQKSINTFQKLLATLSSRLPLTKLQLFLSDLKQKIYDLIKSPVLHEKIGGILIYDQLIKSKIEENSSNITRCANYLKNLLTLNNKNALKTFAQILGDLASMTDTLNPPFVEKQLKCAIEWLQPKCSKMRKYAALLIFKELIEPAPLSVLNHLVEFSNLIVPITSNQNSVLRRLASVTLRNCFVLIEKNKDLEFKKKIFTKLYESCIKRIHKKSINVTIGCIRILTELFRNSGDFLKDKYDESCKLILFNKYSKNIQVGYLIIISIPIIANYSTENFSEDYQKKALSLFKMTLKKDTKHRELIYENMAEFIKSAGKSIEKDFKIIFPMIKESLNKSKKTYCLTSLKCLGELINIFKNKVINYLFEYEFFDLIYEIELCDELIELYTLICEVIPTLLFEIQNRLFLLLIKTLTEKPIQQPDLISALEENGFVINFEKKNKKNFNVNNNLDIYLNKLKLALITFRTFNFEGFNLLEIVREYLLDYLENEYNKIKLESALTCIKILENEICKESLELNYDLKYPVNNFNFDIKNYLNKRSFHSIIITDILEKLLNVAITDPAPNLRVQILKNLSPNFDYFLSQNETLLILNMALTDEEYENQYHAINIIGRLSVINPSKSLPSLRKLLIKLLYIIEKPTDSQNYLKSLKLFTHLIKSSRTLITPYCETFIEKLIPKLIKNQKDNSLEQVIIRNSILSSIGELFEIGGEKMRIYVKIILKLIIDTFIETTFPMKKQIAIHTLGQVIKSTGYVIKPYYRIPNLLLILLNIFKNEKTNWLIRKEILIVIGIIGALDPYKHKLNLNYIQKLNSNIPNKKKINKYNIILLNNNHNSININYNNLIEKSGKYLKQKKNNQRNRNRDRDRDRDRNRNRNQNRHYNRNHNRNHNKNRKQRQMINANIQNQNLNKINNKNISIMNIEDISRILPQIGENLEKEYYPKIAIYVLSKILIESKKIPFLTPSIDALMSIVSIIDIQCIEYLPIIVKTLIQILQTCDLKLKQSIFIHFIDLIKIVRYNIKPYLNEILHSMNKFWNPFLYLQIITLIENLLNVFKNNLQYKFSLLIFKMIEILKKDHLVKKDISLKILKCFQLIDIWFENYLHLIIPLLLKILKINDDTDIKIEIINTLIKFIQKLDLFEYNNLLINSLLIELKNKNSRLRDQIIKLICYFLIQNNSNLKLFLPIINNTLIENEIYNNQIYEDFLKNYLLNSENLFDYEFNFNQIEEENNNNNNNNNNNSNNSNGGNNTNNGNTNSHSNTSGANSYNNSNTNSNENKDYNDNKDNEDNGNNNKSSTKNIKKLNISIESLENSWTINIKKLNTKEKWIIWFQQFCLMCFQESPNPVLRSCNALAHLYKYFAQQLFKVVFLSIWCELNDKYKKKLILNLELALNNYQLIPNTIIKKLLNLCEFMEHVDKPLPISSKKLANIAKLNNSYAQALYYLEIEFKKNPSKKILKSLITINNQIQIPKSAIGLINFAEKNYDIQLKESWFEEFNRWEEALNIYEKKEISNKKKYNDSFNFKLGKLKCLLKLGEINKCNNLCQIIWKNSNKGERKKMARLAAQSAMSIKNWKSMEKYLSVLKKKTKKKNDNSGEDDDDDDDGGGDDDDGDGVDGDDISDDINFNKNQDKVNIKIHKNNGDKKINNENEIEYNFLKAILKISQNKFEESKKFINKTRKLLSKQTLNLIKESYNRAYNDFIKYQQLIELEEIIEYKKTNNIIRKQLIKKIWKKRLLGCQENINVWQNLLSIHSIVFPPKENIDIWLKYSQIVGRSGNTKLSENCIISLLKNTNNINLNNNSTSSGGVNSIINNQEMINNRKLFNLDYNFLYSNPKVIYSYLKHLWKINEKEKAIIGIKLILQKMTPIIINNNNVNPNQINSGGGGGGGSGGSNSNSSVNNNNNNSGGNSNSNSNNNNNTTSNNNANTTNNKNNNENNNNYLWNNNRLQAKFYLKLGEYQLSLNIKPNFQILQEILNSYYKATYFDNNWYKAWHNWAIMNLLIVKKIEKEFNNISQKQKYYLSSSIKGFFKSISLSPISSGKSIQDTLKLLTIWFNYGNRMDVIESFKKELKFIPIKTWLKVIPQLIARINTNIAPIRKLLHNLLDQIGENYPQALIYPLMVAYKSQFNKKLFFNNKKNNINRNFYGNDNDDDDDDDDKEKGKGNDDDDDDGNGYEYSGYRGGDDEDEDGYNEIIDNIKNDLKTVNDLSRFNNVQQESLAEKILEKMKIYYSNLVNEAKFVSKELITIAILLKEKWYEKLDDSFRIYYNKKDPLLIIRKLKPFYKKLQVPPKTQNERQFYQSYFRILQKAWDFCNKYLQTKNNAYFVKAFEIYSQIFSKMRRELKNTNSFDLEDISPKLFKAKNLELAVPGTYIPDKKIIKIEKIFKLFKIIISKQKPRKFKIFGSNGLTYQFLLKGHEDLRQDERVMQLLGLVNTLLINNAETAKRNLTIQRYEVVPLSPNTGLLGWVPNSDTLHDLIINYRKSKNIKLNIEYQILSKMEPDYENLQPEKKLLIFNKVLKKTVSQGNDLEKNLWLNSFNSESWLDRRTNFTRSLAVMSMVGYILGLGDRHPSNLMMNRSTGKINHIDFGDCFEVAIHRKQFPEKIPFRLTRMLVNAMGVSGTHGIFTYTCKNVMNLLRDNKDSVMAMLEAFVYDPLINWRLQDDDYNFIQTNPTDKRRKKKKSENVSGFSLNSFQMYNDKPQQNENSLMHSSIGSIDFGNHLEIEDINKKAIKVIKRINHKLTGRDFDNRKILNESQQVERLIQQAASNGNLSQCYLGWCPYW